MDISILFTYIPVVLRELWRYKFSAFTCFAIIGAIALFLGMTWPVSYSSTMTIYADNQNILKPLLAKTATVTTVKEGVRIVTDSIQSPRILNRVVERVYKDQYNSPKQQEKLVKAIRKKLSVGGLGGSYIKISYNSHSADLAYETLTAISDLFIRDSAESKRSESRDAYEFINAQVKNYKRQLVDAESRLKIFNSDNFDGGSAAVAGRIAGLRVKIEEMHINLDEDRSRITSLEQQLKEESRYTKKAYRVDVYHERLNDLQSRLSSLLLSYTDSHPDVVTLKLQIADLKEVMLEQNERRLAEGSNSNSNSNSDNLVNPLYAELRSKLAEAKVDLNSRLRRLSATEKLLAEEYLRRKRIATREAELAELTRDYDVTRGIYEDMLQRKEKARLSMTLNIEGQGVTYKVQEPASYPLAPAGLRFLYFVMAGPIIGLLIPIVIAVGYVLLDSRLRIVADIESLIGGPLLAVSPHLKSSFTKRVTRGGFLWLGFLGVVYMGAYLGVAFAFREGVIG